MRPAHFSAERAVRSACMQVISSAERLALEHAHAAVRTEGDASKAVEAARVEALRTHIYGLRSVQQQCHHTASSAEKRADELAKKVAEMEKQLSAGRHEVGLAPRAPTPRGSLASHALPRTRCLHLSSAHTQLWRLALPPLSSRIPSPEASHPLA